MRRFYIHKDNIKDNSVTISGKEAHHIKDVIRLKPGDRFTGFDGTGKSYILRITGRSSEIEADIEKVFFEEPDTPKILLACGIPKRAKMDFILEKATELGVSDIVPMITKRTIVKIDKKTAEKKKARWEKIALEASKQCGRNTLPEIHDVSNFKEALFLTESLSYKRRIIPCVCESKMHIKDVLSGKAESTAIFIGPEGDFTEDETGLAKEHGFKTVSLGPFVLKVDTAAVFAVSVACSK